MSKHHGEWQAQGDDVKQPPRGHRHLWGQDAVPTKREGFQWLKTVVDMCTGSQRQRRATHSTPQAERFVRRAPAGGYPTVSKPFYANDEHYPNARIDLEVYGMAFRDDT